MDIAFYEFQLRRTTYYIVLHESARLIDVFMNRDKFLCILAASWWPPICEKRLIVVNPNILF